MMVFGDGPGRRFLAFIARDDHRYFAGRRNELLEHAGRSAHRDERVGNFVRRCHANLPLAVVAEARALDDAGQQAPRDVARIVDAAHHHVYAEPLEGGLVEQDQTFGGRIGCRIEDLHA